jgi:hypothetical protein
MRIAAAAGALARTWQLLQWVFETIPQRTSRARTPGGAQVSRTVATDALS